MTNMNNKTVITKRFISLLKDSLWSNTNVSINDVNITSDDIEAVVHEVEQLWRIADKAQEVINTYEQITKKNF